MDEEQQDRAIEESWHHARVWWTDEWGERQEGRVHEEIETLPVTLKVYVPAIAGYQTVSSLQVQRIFP